jgi:hypothetical protein
VSPPRDSEILSPHFFVRRENTLLPPSHFFKSYPLIDFIRNPFDIFYQEQNPLSPFKPPEKKGFSAVTKCLHKKRAREIVAPCDILELFSYYQGSLEQREVRKPPEIRSPHDKRRAYYDLFQRP